jgi:hypothetical protein
MTAIEQGPTGGGGTASGRGRSTRRFGPALALVLALGGGSYALVTDPGAQAHAASPTGSAAAVASQSQGQATGSSASGAAPAAAAPSAVYHDSALHFSVSSPVDWHPEATTDGVLLAAAGKDAVSIRHIALEDPVDTNNVEAMRAVTDAVLANPGAKVRVLSTQRTTVGGLPALYYLYTFDDAEGTPGAHGHYFVFSGRDMYTVVCQALPASGFQRLAPTFDAVVSTLRVDQ